ncbi:4'-phosphopantetheinyl transferase superfamily protein [Bacillus gobiensis]|uniref:4'-phosphopantetheinyl transferase family protein n=1 Tax=Bacillus gobiensis TaxID=1441095 RepID=UPI003D1BA39C
MSTQLFLAELPDAIDEEMINKAICLLPPIKRERIKSFYHIEDSIRSLLGYMMLQKVLPRSQYPDSISFTEYGKPFVKNQNHFQFNISHSMRLVVLAVSKYEIGVDIEYIKPVCLDSMSGALTKEEYAYLQSLPDDEAEKYFYTIWTVKESFLKMIGTGLSLSPDRLNTNVYFDRPTITLDGKQQNVSFQTFQVECRYQLTVCIRGTCQINNMETLDAAELLKDLVENENMK